jgi:hypothetical protein
MDSFNPDSLRHFLWDFLPNFLGVPWYVAALLMGLLHMGIGTIAALIAQRKGRNFRNWLAIGWLAGTPALIYTLWMEQNLCDPNGDYSLEIEPAKNLLHGEQQRNALEEREGSIAPEQLHPPIGQYD